MFGQLYNWEWADSTLHHARHGGVLQRKKVAYNTTLERRDDGDIALVLHDTEVVRYGKDGTVTLDSGGWRTPTTKERMNSFTTAIHVYPKRGQWMIRCGRVEQPFFDGVLVRADGTLPPVPKEEVVATVTNKKILKMIADYLKGLTPEVWAEVVFDAVEGSTLGDCFYCQIETSGEQLDASHLLHHLDERYYMVSLAANALKWQGIRPEVIPAALNSSFMVKRALRHYLKWRLVGQRTISDLIESGGWR